MSAEDIDLYARNKKIFTTLKYERGFIKACRR